MPRRARVPVLFLAVFMVSPGLGAALAQMGRVGGQVKDVDGAPIKGATIRATNPEASPSTFTSVSDDRGRWSMIGLRSGMWRFACEAPGFEPVETPPVRIATIGAPNPPITFTLRKGTGAAMGALAGVNTKELQAELEAADALLASNQHDQAIAAYQAILTKAPSLTIINLQIGNAYRAKKEYDKAIAAYQEVLKANPADERAKLRIAETSLEKGDFKTAEQLLLEASQTTSATREVFYLLGEVQFQNGRSDEAAKAYQRAAELDPAWGKPIFKLGLVLLNKGDKEGAIQAMEKVMAVDPSSPEAAQAKALIEQLKKSLPQASSRRASGRLSPAQRILPRPGVFDRSSSRAPDRADGRG